MTNVVALKITMGIVGLLLISAAIAMDVFAFEEGATATYSQILLTISRDWWPFLCILSFVFGALQQHIAVAGPPPKWPPASFWYCGAFWALWWTFGRLVAWKWLWQLPSVD